MNTNAFLLDNGYTKDATCYRVESFSDLHYQYDSQNIPVVVWRRGKWKVLVVYADTFRQRDIWVWRGDDFWDSITDIDDDSQWDMLNSGKKFCLHY